MCLEKGYHARIGPYDGSQAWAERAQGWLKVLRTDIWITLIILTLATIPFYILGAGVLNAFGVQPSGTETIVVLSQMFTEILGPWSLWVFAVGAFCILFSSCIAGFAGGGRYIPDYLMELGDASVKKHISDGLVLDRLGVNFDSMARLVLDEDLVVRKLRFLGLEALDELDDEDPLMRHDAEFTLEVGLATKLVAALKKQLGGYA